MTRDPALATTIGDVDRTEADFSLVAAQPPD
jgi:hypothetical protein